MTIDQIAISLILLLTFILFIYGKWRYDIVALISLFVLAFTDKILGEENSDLVINMNEIFKGFSHPAVITVAAVLIISQAMKNSGVVDLLALHIKPFTTKQEIHISSMSGIIAILSGFMNNVGALALMLPVALKTAWEQKRSPRILLMPIAFASILGGMITMIGTPPNIIISNLRQEQQELILSQIHHNPKINDYVMQHFGTNFESSPFKLFDFTPVGGIIAILGVLFIALFGWRMIPRNSQKKTISQSLFSIDQYVTEISIAENSKLIGLSVHEANKITGDKLTIFKKINKKNTAENVDLNFIINESDAFLVMSDPSDLKDIMDEYRLTLSKEIQNRIQQLKIENSTFIEVVVSPESPLIGKTRTYLRRRSSNRVTLMAVARQNKPIHKRLGNITFCIGDVLLMQSDEDSLSNIITTLELLPLAKRDINVGSISKATFSTIIFLGAIGLSIFNIFPTTISFILAILIYIFSGLLPLKNIYKSIDWPVIVLLGSMIPLSDALQNTGTTDLIANQVIYLIQGMPPWFIIGLIMTITMCLSDIINNAATALIMGPISVSIAVSLGFSIDPFLMSVAIGASCAFLTPIGHQCNALILGPGGYRFGDYWKLGLPLEIIIVTVGTPLIIYFWPL
tara:strand:- start:1217 stop:3103 length:1887 start_codon:yes stop_codon:yes gene_type:complete